MDSSNNFILINVNLLSHYEVDQIQINQDQLDLGAIHVMGGLIEKIYRGDEYKSLIDNGYIGGVDVIDGDGKLILPGLTDPQVHLREPGFEYKEDIESGLMSALKGGYTDVVCMPNTKPVIDNEKTIKHIYQRSSDLGLANVYPTASVTIGQEGVETVDFKNLFDKGAIAFTDDGLGIQKDEVIDRAFKELSALQVPLLDHAQCEELSAGGVIHPHKFDDEERNPFYDPRSEEKHVIRGCELSLKYKTPYHVLHISTIGSLNAIKEFKQKGAPVTCEVTPHHLLLNVDDIFSVPKSMRPNFKMNPPLRGRGDMFACQEALIDGTIDMISTDHAPHSKKEKLNGFTEAPFGIIGLETALPLMVTYFVKPGKITYGRLIELMKYKPNQLFKLPIHTIIEGNLATFLLVDHLNSRKYEKSEILSKSKNSPFLNRELTGFVSKTFVKGGIKYADK
ncbi:dihydroorotase [Bacteriovoracaceae bacterium]|nr:dihydroorotase [Bacteriovoracaceae bacterium]